MTHDIVERARAHAATHAESRDVIEGLIAYADALTRTIRRATGYTAADWADDLDPDTGD